MTNRMKCICECIIPGETDEGRTCALSANDKFLYVISVINRCGISADIISATHTNHEHGYYKSRADKLDEHNTIISGPTFGTTSGIGKAVQRLLSLMWIFFYLLFHTVPGETVFVYHKVYLAPVLLVIKKLKKIKLFLEVEEVFYDLQGENVPRWRIVLEDKLIAAADRYVFASKQLERRCNTQHKPYTIVNGRYVTETQLIVHLEDGKKHLVYAGLIEDGKVAFNTVDIALHLPENYQIHIIGYGNKEDVESLCNRIDQVNAVSACHVVYDGVKRGDEYARYLQQCHVGLCPLLGDQRFQNACFPSKITSYLSNGLRVITTENEVVRTSAYGEVIAFSEDATPAHFARAILRIDGSSADPREIIRKLDQQFHDQMKELLQGV